MDGQKKEREKKEEKQTKPSEKKSQGAFIVFEILLI